MGDDREYTIDDVIDVLVKAGGKTFTLVNTTFKVGGISGVEKLYGGYSNFKVTGDFEINGEKCSCVGLDIADINSLIAQLNEVDTPIEVCHCDLRIGGCTCGVFKKEMERKYGPNWRR